MYKFKDVYDISLYRNIIIDNLPNLISTINHLQNKIKLLENDIIQANYNNDKCSKLREQLKTCNDACNDANDKFGKYLNLSDMIFSQIKEEDLNNEMLDLLNSVIIGNNKITRDSKITPIVGSSKWKIHKYPSDIDMMQIYVVTSISRDRTLEIAAKDIVNMVKQIQQKSKATGDIFLADAKIGLNIAFDPFIKSLGTLKVSGYETTELIEYFENIVPNFNSAQAKIELNKIKKIMKLVDFDQINNLLNTTGMTGKIYTEIYNIIRKYYILRWNSDEIILGYKKIYNNDGSMYDHIKLITALNHDTVTKFDIWGNFNDRYVEISNIVAIKWINKNSGDKILIGKQLRNIDERFDEDIDFFSSKEHEKCVKLAKRIWNRGVFHCTTLLHQFDPTQFYIIKKLFLLFTTDINIFSQIKADIELLENALNKIDNLKLSYEKFIKFLFRQIDNIPYKMFKMVYIPKQDYEESFKIVKTNLDDLFNFLTKKAQENDPTITNYMSITDIIFSNIINNTQNKEQIIKYLDNIKKILISEQEKVFCKYLNEYKLHPRTQNSLVPIKYSFNYLNL